MCEPSGYNGTLDMALPTRQRTTDAVPPGRTALMCLPPLFKKEARPINSAPIYLRVLSPLRPPGHLPAPCTPQARLASSLLVNPSSNVVRIGFVAMSILGFPPFLFPEPPISPSPPMPIPACGVSAIRANSVRASGCALGRDSVPPELLLLLLLVLW